MSRLNLDAFKAQANENQTEDLEALSGGILGACHVDRCMTCEMGMDGPASNDVGGDFNTLGLAVAHWLGLHE